MHEILDTEKIHTARKAWLLSKKEFESLNDKAKAAKKKMEAAQTDLNNASEPVEPDLFNDEENTSSTNQFTEEQAMSTEVCHLDISPKTLELLHDKGVKTIKDLTRYEGEWNGFEKIKGIGEAKVEEIHKALDKFWSENPITVEENNEPQEEQCDDCGTPDLCVDECKESVACETEETQEVTT